MDKLDFWMRRYIVDYGRLYCKACDEWFADKAYRLERLVDRARMHENERHAAVPALGGDQ